MMDLSRSDDESRFVDRRPCLDLPDNALTRMSAKILPADNKQMLDPKSTADIQSGVGALQVLVVQPNSLLQLLLKLQDPTNKATLASWLVNLSHSSIPSIFFVVSCICRFRHPVAMIAKKSLLS